MTPHFDLEEERRFLLDSLRDLEREHQAGEIADEDYESLRDDYTARAADVLRAIEANRAAAVDPFDNDVDEVASERARPRRHKRSSRAVALVLVAGLVLLAFASVFVLAGNRSPGGSATGANTNTVQGRLALAHQYESQGKAVDALKQYDAVLKDDPSNVEALTYRGWLLKLAGLTDQAQAAIEKAIATDPTYPDAHFFDGMLLFQDRKDPAAAIPQLEAYLASQPPPPADAVQAVQQVLDQARQAVTTTVPPPTPSPSPSPTTAPAP
jgi:tetratricopeptide (TPR) repeat protein